MVHATVTEDSNMFNKSRTHATVILISLLLVIQNGIGQIPAHPKALSYKELTYQPPKAAEHRLELPNGMIVYIQEDHSLPLFDATAIIRTGTVYDPADKAGLAEMTGAVLRSGGTTTMSGDDLDERLDFLGGSIQSSMEKTSGRVTLSVLKKDIDEGLKLFADVLMNPAFEEARIKIHKDQAIDAIKNSNDNPRTVLDREFRKLLYGDHPLVREATPSGIDAITREDLLAFHRTCYAPNNIILAMAGDFDKKELVEKLNAAFAGWTKRKIELPKIPDVAGKNRPGVFMVQKDINQGYVNIGHFGVKETNPDLFAINLMNFILGGGSFTSRITTRVRSDEGLAYNTGSRFENQRDLPGLFMGYVQTKSATVHYATTLILNEFRRIRTEPVSDEEMATARNFYLDSFPDRFSSAISAMTTLAALEYDGFPADYYDTWRDKYSAVTKEDILRVAKKYIKPGEMSLFIVGDVEKCKAGDEKHPGNLEEFGKITVIALKDPLSGN